MLLVWLCHVCDLSQEVTCRIFLPMLSCMISNALRFGALWILNISWRWSACPCRPSCHTPLPSSGWVPAMFLLLCPPAFLHCDKIPDEDKLKERKLIMAHGFQIQSMDNRPYSCSPELSRGNSDNRGDCSPHGR